MNNWRTWIGGIFLLLGILFLFFSNSLAHISFLIAVIALFPYIKDD